MLELALKYDPALFTRGALELQWSWAAYAATVAGLAVFAALALHVRRAPLRRRDFAVLWTMRTALLALVLFALLDPRLVVEVDEPVRGRVAVLLDDSLSMRIRDLDGSTRSTFVEQAFAPGSGTLATALEQRVDTRYMRFSTMLELLEPGERLTFSGARSRLAEALEQVARAADARSLAAVILVTDGVAGHPGALDDAARALRASSVTVHAIGVGTQRFERDMELSDVHVPRRVLRGDAVAADIVITHRGLAGESATLVVEEESAIVAEQTITLPADGRPATVRIPLEFSEAGPRRLAFRLTPQAGEMLVENNTVHRSVQVRGRPVRILHIEGEPRFEVKFLRRAVAADDGIHLVSLVRTAENKYYRLGVEDAGELAGGLPQTDEALFHYEAIVIGSIGDELLDDAQQARLRDFVARRGGGLVLLGGRRAFSEGGYARSTLAGISPVVLPAAASAYRVRVPVRPTPNGRGDPLLRLAPGDAHELWERLPPLTMVNPIRRAKPGATTILEGRDRTGKPLVVLAWQRYGRGTVAAFPVRDSWRWQMHADIPLDDKIHERLWRNLLRHVARSAGGRVRLHVEPRPAALGDTVSVRAEVLGADYRPLARADVMLTVTTPGGEVEKIPLERTLEGKQVRQASFVAREVGRHHLRVRLGGGEPGIHADMAVEVSGVGREFHDAELDAARLQRLTDATGGRFFRTWEAAGIVEAVDDATGTRRVQRRLPLRDVPLLLVLVITLACLEWVWRRRRGLA